MNKKQNKNTNIKNVRVQLLENAHPQFQETIAYYECDGEHFQIPFFIERVKNASTNYYIKETKKELYKLKNLKKPYKHKSGFSLKHAILVASLSAICGAGISVGAIYTAKAINEKNNGKIEVTFNAGIGQFGDGSRIKTVTVNKGTKLSQIPHDTPSFISDINVEWISTYEYIRTYEFQSTSGWLTESGEYIGENDNIAFNKNTCLFAGFSSADIPTVKSIAISKMSNAASEAMARQPGITSKIQTILYSTCTYLDTIKNCYEILAVGDAAAHGFSALARQPEMEGTINDVLSFGYDQFHQMTNDGRSVGLGIMLGQGIYSIAEQPEVEDDDKAITNAMKLAYDYASEAKSAMDGYSSGIIVGSGTIAIARQPGEEVEGKIFSNTIKKVFEYLDYSDDIYESFAIGEATASALISIALAPEAEEIVFKTLKIGLNVFHAQPNDGRIEGISKTTAGACESVCRRPDVEGKISSAAEIIYLSLPNVTTPKQGQAIGYAGAGACDAIARQPENVGKITTNLYVAVYRILNA